VYMAQDDGSELGIVTAVRVLSARADRTGWLGSRRPGGSRAGARPGDPVTG